MTVPTSRTQSVSSPAATGGAGTFFEQHVDAYWLALLLVRGIPPILLDCSIVEVQFQAERLGWNTDDFVVICENGVGSRRQLLGQVKRTFSVSATDDVCRKAIQDFWKDFKNDRFSPATDRFALVTLRGTNTLLEYFSGLLDCARAARDAAEFGNRLTTTGFLSAKAVGYCVEIRTIIGECEGESVSSEEIWPFLRLLHVLSLDLNSDTGQTEAVIKTLLAHTSREQDALGSAEGTWNSLLREVGEGMPQARAYLYHDLPDSLRQRHSSVGAPEDGVLRALHDHSLLILDGIRDTIGSALHLVRGSLVQQVFEKMEAAQVVLVTGAAGSGKSSVAKDSIGVLAADHFTFGFRAEEFASPHFDITLQRNQVPASAAKLSAILAGQGRKVMLVESVERLLEASTRDAFSDLLTLVSRDKSWRVILTCRDYSIDLVRTCFLESARIGHAVVVVPPLDDQELHDVETIYPILVSPLTNEMLRKLLRNPYVLDKALQISWSNERLLPQTELEFRALFWQEIVRVDHRAAGGMPRQREAAFQQIALRRARALTLYAACDDLPANVVHELRRDSLVVSPREAPIMLAPGHDVLEDWAIFQWINEQYAICDGSASKLSAALGTYPAVRRTYRKWVSELVEREAATADELFQAVLRDAGLPSQFRDDTLVSLLRSPASPEFLERHRAQLFSQGKQLLRRVIHLLRVACMTTPTWLETTKAHASLFSVPVGLSWGSVLHLVHAHFNSFDSADHPLLLGLIEDWARGVSWQCPYPDGHGFVAAIAHWMLPNVDDFRSEVERKRILTVIAKIPNSDRERFETLLVGKRDAELQTNVTDDLLEIVLEGIEGMPAARDVPELVIAVAKSFLLTSNADQDDEQWYSGTMELEPLFGIHDARSQGFFPASANRGPFLSLLQHHPVKGLAFIIEILNCSTDCYAHPRVFHDHVEQPSEESLIFSDGTSKVQWCNERLWNLYRGTSVGPYVLQSLLMCLERWLLDIGKMQSRDLDAILLHILRQSNSAALTAVVASAATAFPNFAGETLLVLLRSAWCIWLDRKRLIQESQAPSRLTGIMGRLNAGNEFYEKERKKADNLPHRGRDLEMAIVTLQLGPFVTRVHEILDQQRASMPPVEAQKETDHIRRLAIHRMDLRQYNITEEQGENGSTEDTGNTDTSRRLQIHLGLRPPEPDVKEMVDQNTIQQHNFNSKIVLQMWGMNVFRGEHSSIYEPGLWRQRLAEARAASEVPQYESGHGGPGYIAAAIARDHWDELDKDEQEWCVNRVCSEVESTADHWNRTARRQPYDMDADRPCANILPLFLGRSLNKSHQARVRNAFVVALTHAINEVRDYVVSGIGKVLWTVDRELVLRCVNALAMEARLVQEAVGQERARLTREKKFDVLSAGSWIDRVESTIASRIRQQFFEENGISGDALLSYDPAQWFGAEANSRIIAILAQAPNEQVAIEEFCRLGHIFVGWWNADGDNRRARNRGLAPDRRHETESAQMRLLQNFVLRTSETDAATIVSPLADAVDRHPDKVHWFVLGLIEVEDGQSNAPQFWSLWKQFSEKVHRAPWLVTIDDEHARGAEMLSALFLGTWWKESVQHWQSLEGYAELIHVFFDQLPACSRVLDDYVRFLYHVGSQSLPNAFVRIANKLQQGEAGQMLRKTNTVYLLEVLLQRHVYGRPLELKRRNDLRNAILHLLDDLTENGSSAAFKMRDDFVTPLPPA